MRSMRGDVERGSRNGQLGSHRAKKRRKKSPAFYLETKGDVGVHKSEGLGKET